MKLYSGRYRYCKYDVIECKKLLNNTKEYLMNHPDLYYFSDDESDDDYIKSNGISYGVSIECMNTIIEFYIACLYKNGNIEYKYKTIKKIDIKLGFINTAKIGTFVIDRG